ncbi:Uncharacterised protein [Collinsella aerofaciens]|nr:Uncharacterised protein [Collinsella aerofaciens]
MIGMRSALSAMGISTYSMGRFEEFAPDNPNVKPSPLVVPTGMAATSPHPTGWWHSAGKATHTSWTPTWNDVYHRGDTNQIFLNSGHPYTVLPMDNSGYRASVTWNSVGTYCGRPVGCTLSLSNPVIGNGYDNNAGLNQKRAQFYQQHFGTKSFFVVSDAFAAWDNCHWLQGLRSIRMVYQFFYSDRAGEYIDLDWAYLGARSIQHNAGGYEWISPAENNQDAYFIPRGMDTQLFFTNFDGYSCISSRVDEVSDRTCGIIAYKGSSISCVRGDTVYCDGFQFDFQPIADFYTLKLKKASTNPAVTPIDPEYFSLSGAEYAIYCDEACTRKCGTFTTDENGEAVLAAVNGTNKLVANTDYWVKETSAPQGYKIDETVHKIRLNGNLTIEVSDVPKHSTVHFMLIDTLGGAQEVHTVYIKSNSTYTASEHQADFSDARAAIERAMRDEGQDMSLLDKCLDGWYEGDDKCSDPDIFGGPKFTSKKVNGDLYLWAWVTMGKFYFYKDGTDKTHLLFKSQRYLTGTNFVFPAELATTQLEPMCNLNDKFGTDPSTGFTGWHLDMKLGDEAITSCVAGNGITALYGRNRCTLRTEYAPGSVELDPSWDMRLLPEETAEAHPGFIPTFDEPKHKGYDAKGREFELAAIGDSGEGHTAYYWDELARITVPATAYRNLGGGQWRTYKCEAWLDADGANAAAEVSETGVSGRLRSRARAASAVKMTADTVRYIRWTEVVSDGVVGVRRK